MKKILLLQVLTLVMLQMAAQSKTISIHGIVKDTSIKTVVLTHLLDEKLTTWKHDTLKVENGTFNISIQIPFPLKITIAYNHRLYEEIFICSDATITIDTAGAPHIIRSPMQDEYEQEFLPFFRSNKKVYDSLHAFFQRVYSKYTDGFPETVKDSGRALQKRYYGQRDSLLSEYIKRHPDSYVALWDIYFFVEKTQLHKYFEFEKLFSAFSGQVQQQSFMAALKEKTEGADKMQVGQLFPEDFFKGYETLQSKLSKNGQYTLIDFWYSHCGPCVKGFPKLKKLYTQYRSKGFEIVSVSTDKKTDKKDYLAAIKKYGLVWNHVWDKDGLKAKRFNVTVFPTYVLLDRNGQIINANIGDGELEAFLKENL